MAVRTKVAQSLLAAKRLGQMGAKLQRIAELKDQLNELSAELEALELDVAPVLIAYDRKHWDEPNGDSFTAVAPTRTYYDEKGMRRELGEEIWQQIVKESMDREKLGGLVTAGVVKAEVVARHATITQTKPYILVTRKGSSTHNQKAA